MVASGEEGKIQDRKFEPFDKMLGDMKLKCSNEAAFVVKVKTALPFDRRYTVDYTCKYHPPYPAGSCHRCVPETVVLNR